MEDLKLQIEELKREIDTMKQAQNLDQNELLYSYLELNKNLPSISNIGSYGADLTRTISIDATPDSFQVPENPTNTAIIRIGSNYYRILLYSLT